MNLNKKLISFKLSETILDYLDEYAKENSLNRTTALENIIMENKKSQEEYNEKLTKLIVEKMDEKYKNLFTHLRLSTNFSDRNVQIMMEMLNSIIVGLDLKYPFTSRLSKSKIWEESERFVGEKIAGYKQIKDNKQNKNGRK